MALSSIVSSNSYYSAAEQLVKDFHAITKKRPPEKISHNLVEGYAKLEQLYAQLAPNLNVREFKKLDDRHQEIKKILYPQSKTDATGAVKLSKLLEQPRYKVEVYEIFDALSIGTQRFVFELLCLAHGSPTKNIVVDGVDHFFDDPGTLLKKVKFDGHTLRIIDHLILKMGGKVFIDVEPWHPEKSWESDLKLLSREEICQSMDQLLKSWNVNQKEAAIERAKSGAKEENNAKETPYRKLNKEIFLHMKREFGVKTPMEFIDSLQGHDTREPRRIGDKQKQFIPKDDEFYRIEGFKLLQVENIPLRKPGEQGDAVEGNNQFDCAVKKKGNDLYLYLDGCTNSYIRINEDMYPSAGRDRRGLSEPSYRFKEGDIVSTGGSFGKYLFTVGKNGTILYPAEERIDYARSEQAIRQSSEFAKTVACKDGTMSSYRYTSKKQSAEIGEPLEPGFSFFRKSSGNLSLAGDLTFVDVPNDPVLKGLVAYLKTEFEAMKYTDTQKMVRIAHIAADLLQNEIVSYELKYNYLLGEVIRSGAGPCRHRAALVKVLCDALHLPCALVAGLVDKTQVLVQDGKHAVTLITQDGAGHMWNVMEIDGKRHIVDPMHKCIFSIDNPPGDSDAAQQTLKDYYGAK